MRYVLYFQTQGSKVGVSWRRYVGIVGRFKLERSRIQGEFYRSRTDKY